MPIPPIRFRTRNTSLVFNMAPMIDVVFLLIIFFVLVSTFASAERIPMDIPDPDESQARNVKLTDRVIINIQPAGGDGSEVTYSIGSSRPTTLDEISDRLHRQKKLVPELKVVIRADKRVRYAAVRKVMSIVAENGIQKMNMVAHVGHGAVEP